MEYDHRYQQQLQVPKPKYDCLLFDVDDTLYPPSSGFSEQCAKNIIEYMIDKLGMEESEVPHLCFQLYKDYGTTLAGLRALGYDVDCDDFHSFVHGSLPYEILKPDTVLKNLLHSLPYRKMVFSNANEVHVAQVLHRLGLEDCFEGIICFETLNSTEKTNMSDGTESSTVGTTESTEDSLSDDTESSSTIGTTDSTGDSSELPKSPVVCKPNEQAFVQACKIADIDPQSTLFFDDNLGNLQAAKRVGLDTVLIGSSHRTQGVDYALESIHNIREALPELWEALEKTESVCCSEKIAMETTVTA